MESRPLGYADVGRYGLAHSLLAWARCELWCADNEVEMLAPSWFHVRIGPYLRRESDKRTYHKFFRFPRYVTGIRRAYILARYPRICAEDAGLRPAKQIEEKSLIVFSNRMSLNEETHFQEIVGRQAQVRSALESMTVERYRRSISQHAGIALHVRMGDFLESATDAELRQGKKNSRLPIKWYTKMLTGIRQRLGAQVPAVVYSDGNNDSLRDLLSLPSVVRAPIQPAIVDLFGLSNANLLISSGSGFSMWGSYLGNVPRICFPGQRFTRVLVADGVELEPEIEDVAALPDEFICYVARVIGEGNRKQ